MNERNISQQISNKNSLTLSSILESTVSKVLKRVKVLRDALHKLLELWMRLWASPDENDIEDEM